MASVTKDVAVRLAADTKDYQQRMDGALGPKSALGKVGIVAGAATAAAGAAVVAFGAKAVGEFASLEKGMNEVFTLLPGISDDAMSAMTQDVQDFSREMGVLPDDVVPALYDSLSAGVPKDNVFDFLETANKLAVGGVTDLNTAVDGLTSATNAYAGSGLEAEHASNVMFTAVKAGKTTVEEISSSIGKLAPTAASVGVTFEELNAGIATLTSQGIATSESVSGMKAAIANVIKPSGNMVDVFHGMVPVMIRNGELTGDNADRYLELSDQMDENTRRMGELKAAGEETGDEYKELEKANKGLGDTLDTLVSTMGPAIIESQGLAGTFSLIEENATGGRDGLSQVFGSVEGLNAVLAMTSEEGGAKFLETMEAMEDSSGATDEAFETMDKGIARTWERIQASTAAFMTEVGERLAPVVTAALNFILETWNNMQTGILNAMDAISKAVTAAWEFIAGLLERNAEQMEGDTSELMDALTGIWEALVSVIGTLVKRLAALWTDVLWPTWQTIEPLVSAAFSAVVIAVETAVKVIDGVLTALAAILEGDFRGAWEGMRSAVEAIVTGLARVLETLFDGVRKYIENVVDRIAERVESVWKGFTGAVETVTDAFSGKVGETFDRMKAAVVGTWEALKAAVVAIVDAFAKLIEGRFGTLRSVVEGATSALSTAVQATWEALQTAVVATVAALRTALEAAWSALTGWLTGDTEALNVSLSTIFGTIAGTIESVVNAIDAAVRAVWSALTDWLTGSWEATAAAADRIWNAIVATVTGLVGGAAGTVTAVWDSLAEGLETTWNAISDLAGTVWSGIRSTIEGAFSGLAEWASGIFGEIVDRIGGMVSNVADRINGAWDAVSGIFSRADAAEERAAEAAAEASAALDAADGTTSGGGEGGGGGSGGGRAGPDTELADGGIVTRDLVARVGEAGPEAVIPLDRLGGMGGESTIVVELDGRAILRSVAPRLTDEVRLRTGIVAGS